MALWNGARAWLFGAQLYLPEAWLTPAQRTRACIPPGVQFQPKWQLALTLWRQVRAAGFEITAVVGDAEFGDNATLRRTFHRAKLPHALGVSSDLKLFVGTPALQAPPPLTSKGRPLNPLHERGAPVAGDRKCAVRPRRGAQCDLTSPYRSRDRSVIRRR